MFSTPTQNDTIKQNLVLVQVKCFLETLRKQIKVMIEKKSFCENISFLNHRKDRVMGWQTGNGVTRLRLIVVNLGRVPMTELNRFEKADSERTTVSLCELVLRKNTEGDQKKTTTKSFLKKGKNTE